MAVHQQIRAVQPSLKGSGLQPSSISKRADCAYVMLHVFSSQTCIQVLYSMYVPFGPWFAARFLSSQPMGLFLSQGVLLSPTAEASWQWLPCGDTLMLVNRFTFFTMLPGTLWLAGVVSHWYASLHIRPFIFAPLYTPLHSRPFIFAPSTRPFYSPLLFAPSCSPLRFCSFVSAPSYSPLCIFAFYQICG